MAGSRARGAGGLNGAMTAVFGLLVGIVLAILLILLLTFTGGNEFPPSPVGLRLGGGGFLSGLVLFLANLLGGYVGGRLGGSRR